MPKAAKKSRSITDALPAESDTKVRLLGAAAAEFNEGGFSGTDTNRIARRAGFAPQTFYRWFKDKTEIFIAAYQAWEDVERRTLGRLLADNATTKQLIDALVGHHRDYKVFRRSLRLLSLEDDSVRRARAASRVRQIAQLQVWRGKSGRYKDADDAALATLLLQMERLADALAEQEFEDMNVSPAAAHRALADIIEGLRSK